MHKEMLSKITLPIWGKTFQESVPVIWVDPTNHPDRTFLQLLEDNMYSCTWYPFFSSIQGENDLFLKIECEQSVFALAFTFPDDLNFLMQLLHQKQLGLILEPPFNPTKMSLEEGIASHLIIYQAKGLVLSPFQAGQLCAYLEVYVQHYLDKQ